MGVLDVALRVGVIVGTMLVVSTLTIVGPARLRRTRGRLRARLRAAQPSLIVLAAVLGLNSLVRDVSGDLSYLVGINVTDDIHMIEGAFVASVQSLSSPLLTQYFSFVYVYGYVFLLVFPVLAYLALEDERPLQTLAIAYILNYAIGLLCYLVFIAYGPRNLMPDLVEPLLYTSWPESQLLTSEVNRNTNVFPSLHTSLSLTVGILAYRTRDVYPAWTPIAALGAASVAISTMYLGIHWGVDVVGGIVLAVGSVAGVGPVRSVFDRHSHRLPDLADRAPTPWRNQ